MNAHKRNYLAKFSAAIAFLMKQGRTAPELAELCEASLSTVEAHLRALHAEGLVYISERRRNPQGRATNVWAWQPSVCAVPDAPPLEVQWPRKGRVSLAERAGVAL